MEQQRKTLSKIKNTCTKLASFAYVLTLAEGLLEVAMQQQVCQLVIVAA